MSSSSIDHFQNQWQNWPFSMSFWSFFCLFLCLHHQKWMISRWCCWWFCHPTVFGFSRMIHVGVGKMRSRSLQVSKVRKPYIFQVHVCDIWILIRCVTFKWLPLKETAATDRIHTWTSGGKPYRNLFLGIVFNRLHGTIRQTVDSLWNWVYWNNPRVTGRVSSPGLLTVRAMQLGF